MKNKFLFLTLFLLEMFFSCRKYDEGGKLFWADHRLVKKWTLVQYTIDGADSLHTLQPCLLGNQGIRIYSTNNGGANVLECFPYFNYNIVFGYGKTMIFTIGDYLKNQPNERPFMIPSNETNEWEILELTKSEVKLRMVYGKEYVVVLR